MVEYALGVAFVGAAAISAIQGLEGATGDEVQRKSSAGAPDLGESFAQSVTTVPTTITAEPPSTTTEPAAITRATAVGAGVRDRGNIWIASVTVTVTDASTGAVVPQAVVTGRWGGAGGDASCITQSDGRCPMTLADLDRRSTTSVTFSVLSVTDGGVATTQAPNTLTIGAPA